MLYLQMQKTDLLFVPRSGKQKSGRMLFGRKDRSLVSKTQSELVGSKLRHIEWWKRVWKGREGLTSSLTGEDSVGPQ